MAVVKTFDGYFAKINHKVKVKYSNRTEKFTIALPSAVWPAMGKEVESDTLSGVERAFKEASVRYMETATTEKKVILVEFECSMHEEGYSWDHGVRLNIQAGVFLKSIYKRPGDSTIEEYDQTESSIPDLANFGNNDYHGGHVEDGKCIELPWTEETENRITTIVKALMALGENMAKVTKSKKSLLDFVNTQKLLPEYKDD